MMDLQFNTKDDALSYIDKMSKSLLDMENDDEDMGDNLPKMVNIIRSYIHDNFEKVFNDHTDIERAPNFYILGVGLLDSLVEDGILSASDLQEFLCVWMSIAQGSYCYYSSYMIMSYIEIAGFAESMVIAKARKAYPSVEKSFIDDEDEAYWILTGNDKSEFSS